MKKKKIDDAVHNFFDQKAIFWEKANHTLD